MRESYFLPEEREILKDDGDTLLTYLLYEYTLRCVGDLSPAGMMGLQWGC